MKQEFDVKDSRASWQKMFAVGIFLGVMVSAMLIARRLVERNRGAI